REYRNTSKIRILSVIGNHKVTKLNTMSLQRFTNDLVDEGLSPRYIEYINTILYGALESARIWKIIDVNPLIDVERPRPRRKTVATWTVEEMHSFLNAAKPINLSIYTIVSLAVKTGLRRGEILALKWNDINFEEQTVAVNRS